ncbi:adenylyltransferase/cytidyltransferase family protein [Pseudoalteromonas neustonica]|uniref:Adenylyltransferase/cytidyltransferase family protein n=1 Tax=Pseudoalteromonas neustonica TaxID=1840331 RepID=A0ABY3FGM9_9GAMM|nr:adenylyltransferase/cytidyltransferase family protein [Pseudoalteromonas neustonica]TVU85106.1 adenylyltransferase/cytidyltransferase family protein [Pseudoalteromonas neustonica]
MTLNSQIHSLNSDNKSSHNTRCLALGVFDLFHIGHLNYLKFSKAQGSELFVAVASDDLCFENKNTFPIINQHERMAIISALAIVDHVALVPSPIVKTQSTCKWIQAWGVNKVVVGGQWQNSERWNEAADALQAYDIDVMFAPQTPNISSSGIKKKIITSYSDSL